MGVSNDSNGGGKTNYLRFANGFMWQTGKGLDTENVNYHEEEYEKVGGEKATRKGYRYNALDGVVESAFVHETKYGDVLDVYFRDQDSEELYCLSLKIDGNWTSGAILKKVVIALMLVDKSKPLTVRSMLSVSDNGFESTTVWFIQDGMNLQTNPYKEEIDETKVKKMPSEIVDVIVGFDEDLPSKEEVKAMSQTKKKRHRENEVEMYIDYLKENVLPSLNEETEAKAEEKVEKPKEKAKTEPTPKKEEKPKSDFEYKTDDEIAALSPKDRLNYKRALKKHEK